MKTVMVLCLLFGLSALGAGHTHNTSTMHKPMNKSLESSRSQVLDFTKGQVRLTTEQKASLKRAFFDAKKHGEEFDMKMLVWADEPFPGPDKALSKYQQRLASERIEMIEKYINTLKVDIDDIEAYNMAKGSNWFSKLTNNEENQLKTMMASDESQDEIMKEEFSMVKSKGAPGKAVVIIALDD